MKKLKSFYILIKKLGIKIKENKIAVHSAEAAFFVIIAFFPTTMLLLTLLNYLPFSAEQMQDFSLDFLPSQAGSLVESLLSEISRMSSGAVISAATITALWSASRGVLAIIKGLNSIYDVDEKRGFIKLRLFSMLYMLSFMAILIITLIILVFGSAIIGWLIETFPFFNGSTLLFKWMRWVLGFCLLVLFFWLLFSFAPGKVSEYHLNWRKSGSFKELPGAIISAGGWVGFSALYSFYITHFANYSYLYGSLTAIVLLMLWLYFCMNIMFFGAQFNVFVRDLLNKYSTVNLSNQKIRGLIRRKFERN